MDEIIPETTVPTRQDEGLLAVVLKRLPRILGVTALAMVVSFFGLHLTPTQYRARLALPVASDSTPAAAIDLLLSPLQLADIAARLPSETLVALQRDGGETLDSSAILRRQMTLLPETGSNQVRLEAVAASAEHARAIVEAIAASYTAAQSLPEPLAVSAAAAPAPVEEASPTAPPGVPLAETGDPRLLQQRLTLAWENRVRLAEKAERIDALISAENFSALALQAEGLPGLGRRIEDLATLEAEREKLAITLLPNHPTMRALIEQIALVSTEVRQEAGQLAAMVQADSEAAARLEARLRAEYDAQLASVAVDETVMTSAIAATAAPEVSPLPRPINPLLALGLSGGLAFFGQLGLIAWRQPRRLGDEGEDASVMDDTMFAQPIEPVALDPEIDAVDGAVPHVRAASVAPAASVVPVADADDWQAMPPSDVAVTAHWLGQDAPAAPRLSVPQEPVPAAAVSSPAPVPDPLDALDTARIVAIRSIGSAADTRAWARDLLDVYAEEGRRVVMIDASSRHRGAAPGISDLSVGRASFADIIHGTGRNEAALIPWGRQETLYASARQVRTLLLALVELYDVVVITLAPDADGSSHLVDMADLVLAATPRAAAARDRVAG